MTIFFSFDEKPEMNLALAKFVSKELLENRN